MTIHYLLHLKNKILPVTQKKNNEATEIVDSDHTIYTQRR